MRLAELLGNSPQELARLLLQITMLKENTRLELTKLNGHLIVRKEENNEITTLKLDYRDESN